MAAPIGPGDWHAFTEFSPRVACDPTSGCWLWAGARTAGGYGKVKIGGRRGKEIYTHRLSYMLNCGPIPRGVVVCHRCDTPACCNPTHLFLGTQGDNVRDAYAKGRLTYPEAGVTPESIIADIKAALAAGVLGRVIASDYGISAATVSAIKTGKRWAHVAPRKAPSRTKEES
jgi:hypothetical protein